MFWNKKKNDNDYNGYNEYELEYKKNENLLASMHAPIRKLASEIYIKDKACRMYLVGSHEYAEANDEIQEKKKQLHRAMDEYMTQRELVIDLLATTKDHFVTLGKDRSTPATARHIVEVAIRYQLANGQLINA